MVFLENTSLKLVYLFLIPLLLISSMVSAQEVLTPEKAIELLLKNNYSIQIARDDSASVAATVSRGNAGMLPQIGVVAGGTVQNSSINQRFSNGLEVNTSGVSGNGINARTELGWTLFDGGKMFTTYNRLKEQQQQAGLSLKMVIENEIEKTLINYYSIVRMQDELKARLVAFDLYSEQVAIIEAKVAIGSASRQELLQSKVDRNAAKSAVLMQQVALENAKLELYRLLVINQDAEYIFPEQSTSVFNQNLDELKKKSEASNTQLSYLMSDKRLREFSLNESKAERLPSLGLTAAYGFNRTSSSAGFALFNQSTGPNAGLTLTWNLFNGSQLNSRIKQSSIQVNRANLMILQEKEIISTQVKIAFKQWLQSKEILELELENLAAAEENLKLATERLRLGQIGILPLKESQRSFQEAISRKSEASFATAQAEVALMKLSGQLVK